MYYNLFKTQHHKQAMTENTLIRDGSKLLNSASVVNWKLVCRLLSCCQKNWKVPFLRAQIIKIRKQKFQLVIRNIPPSQNTPEYFHQQVKFCFRLKRNTEWVRHMKNTTSDCLPSCGSKFLIIIRSIGARPSVNMKRLHPTPADRSMCSITYSVS